MKEELFITTKVWVAEVSYEKAKKAFEKSLKNLDHFDFKLSAKDMAAIATLDTGKSLFFDHRDPAIVKWLGKRI